MLSPDVVLQEHMAGGNPTLVAYGRRHELTEQEKVLWLKIIVASIQPNEIVAKPCECVSDE